MDHLNANIFGAFEEASKQLQPMIGTIKSDMTTTPQHHEYLIIGPLAYEVVEVDAIDGNADMMGSISVYEQTLEIKSGLRDSVRAVTLLHEALHAIAIHIGQDKVMTEDLVEALGYQLYQLIRDNESLTELCQKE